MKVVIIATVLLLGLVVHAQHICDDKIINAVNTDPSSTWTAGCSNRFMDHDLAHAKMLLMDSAFLVPSDTDTNLYSHGSDNADIPESFDARQQWPGCVHPIRDQARCGSCWAFGATEALSDRFCIASNGSVNVILSPQDLVSCDKSNKGCNGGRLNSAWHYMQHTGVALDSCVPYTSQSGTAPPCPKQCSDGTAIQKYHAKNYYHVGSAILFWRRESDIQQEIMTNGPVETGFMVYQDFMSYQSGIYQHKTGSLLGGHAVKIVGWGVENSVPYWIVANSWGTSWGEEGFFRILRGKNSCDFEAQVYAGLPAI